MLIFLPIMRENKSLFTHTDKYNLFTTQEVVDTILPLL